MRARREVPNRDSRRDPRKKRHSVILRMILATVAREGAATALATRDIGGQEIAKPLGDLFPADDALLHQHRQELREGAEHCL